MTRSDRVCGILAAVLMVVYGSAWCYFFRGPWTVETLVELFMPVLIGVVGILFLLKIFTWQPGDPAPIGLGRYTDLYWRAWKSFWGQRWLNGLFGIVALINVLSAVLMSALTLIMWHPMLQSSAQQPLSNMPNYFLVMAVSAFKSSGRNILNSFVPKAGLSIASVGGVIIGLIVLVAIIWLYKRIKSTQSLPGTAYLRTALPIIAIATVSYLALDSADMYKSWIQATEMSRQASAANAHINAQTTSKSVKTFKGKRIVTQVVHAEMPLTHAGLLGIVVLASVNGFLVGGLIMGLKRQTDIRAHFLSDCIAQFPSMLLLFLIYGLLTFTPYLLYRLDSAGGLIQFILTILTVIAFSFAPFRIADKSERFSESAAGSLRIWRRDWKQLIPFIALGYMIFAIVRFAENFLWYAVVTNKGSYLQLPVYAIFAMVGVLCQAIALMALWEFYSSNYCENSAFERHAN
ncbi:MAG: hypothetical protein ABFD83_05500 [Armatimonadota bacterium]